MRYQFAARQADPELRVWVAEASLALARLDADRLEELAASCEALNRRLDLAVADGRGEPRLLCTTLTRQAIEASGEMQVLGSVLEATRANLQVLNRLRQTRLGTLEYSEMQARGWSVPRGAHGDD